MFQAKRFNISDLRFIAEYNSVKELKGNVLMIQRDICKPGNHASEKEIQKLSEENKFDFVIDNNSTLKDLFNNLKKIYNNLI